MNTPRSVVMPGLLLLLLVFLAPALAAGQTGAASLTGIVTDDSGAAVPGAAVIATSQATNVEYTGLSNATGNYTITSVPVGAYVVRAELSGFKTAATKPIQVEARQIARLDFKLELGSLEETVLVTGESPVLQTESATVGEVISGTTVAALPLNGRNTGQLSLLLPGVVTPNPGSFTSIRNFGGGRPFVNGNREQTNNYTIDGIDMNESIDNLVAYQPSPDALAQISVETNNYSADSGNVAGAVISNVIKSGSNGLPGKRVRVLPRQPHGCESVVEQPLERAEAGTPAGHLRGNAGRPARQERAVLLRELPGHTLQCSGVRDPVGRPGKLAQR